MSTWFSKNEMKQVAPADKAAFRSPVPTQIVSNGEYNPLPQTPRQRQVEARLTELAEANSKRLGLDRRRFLQTASGMAAAFVAMNDVFGPVFNVGAAEVAEPEAADERARKLSRQLIFDDQTHFVRDDYKNEGILSLGRFAAKHWNPAMLKEQGLKLGRYKFENFIKEIFLDSDTKVALLSGAPFDDPKKWLLSNEQMAATRKLINGVAGSRRLLAHAVFTPGTPGWMDEVDKAIDKLKPDSWKGYTVGDPGSPGQFPWRLDDEKLMYPFYEKIKKAGIKTVCIHKGLMPRDYEKSWKGIWQFATVDDVPKAAKDWPDLNFVMYHAALRPFMDKLDVEAKAFEQTGRIDWVSDLAAIPKKHNVKNVYAEIGTAFASVVITNPRLAAGMLGQLIKEMGADHVIWGTDAVWYGSPQWQIEALRRLEIPNDLQKKFGYQPLGPSNGKIKRHILWDNGAKFYGLKKERAYRRRVPADALDEIKAQYKKTGIGRSNTAYGYVSRAV